MTDEHTLQPGKFYYFKHCCSSFKPFQFAVSFFSPPSCFPCLCSINCSRLILHFLFFRPFTFILQFILFYLLFLLAHTIQVSTFLLLCSFSHHLQNCVISYEQTLSSAKLNILSISILFNTRSIFYLKEKRNLQCSPNHANNTSTSLQLSENFITTAIDAMDFNYKNSQNKNITIQMMLVKITENKLLPITG